MCKELRCVHHLYSCHLCEQPFCMQHWSPGSHKCLQRNDLKGVPEEVPQDVWTKAEAARGLILHGTVLRRPDFLMTALRMMYLFPPSRVVTAHTGLSLLLTDSTVWMIIEDEKGRGKVKMLEERWKVAAKAQRGKVPIEECRHPSGGSKGKYVSEKMQHWKSWC